MKKLNDLHSGHDLLIIGPSLYSKKYGGVIRHIHVLSSLAVLQGATFYDPGSTDGKITWRVIGVFWSALRVWKVARRIKASNVWINTSIYPMAFLKLLLILTGMRMTSGCVVRVFFHGGRFETIGFLKSSVIRKVCWAILHRALFFHFLSVEQGKGFSIIFPASEWKLFSNFIPETSLLPKRSGKTKSFLFVGRLIKEKGVNEIVMAIDSLHKQGLWPDGMEFWFVGDGPEMDMLQGATYRFSDGTIRILGVLSSGELDSVYQSSFALVLPSYAEGFPYVVIEAMRAGLPLICTSTGVLADLVKPHVNGLVIQAGDIKGLADAMKTLICDEILTNKLGKNNAKFFLDNLSGYAAEEFYDKLLKVA